MMRFAAGVLLLSMVLPYARSPLCEAGQHVHMHGEGRAAITAAHDAGNGGPDCHTLMGCNILTQHAVVVAQSPVRFDPSSSAVAEGPDLRRAEPAHAPVAPPPKPV